MTGAAPGAPTLRCVARAHFRIFGIPIRVEPFFFIVVALFGINLEPLWTVFAFVAVAFVSVLVHELGHAVTYRLLGQRSAIVLHGFGGFTVPAGGGRRVLSKPKSVMVSISGALTQLILLGIPFRLLANSDMGTEEHIRWFFDGGFSWWPIASLMATVSIWWALFNLLPIRPLDGGHVAETLFGFQAACKLSIGASIVAAFIGFRLGFGLIVLMYFGLFAFLNFRDLREDQQTGTFDVEAPDAAGGRGGARATRRRSRANLSVVSGREAIPDLTPRLPLAEAETRAWNALRCGDGSRAASIMRQAGDGGSPFLRASIALVIGPVEMADDLFEAAYQAQPGGPPNLVPATLLADAGRAVPVAARLCALGRRGGGGGQRAPDPPALRRALPGRGRGRRAGVRGRAPEPGPDRVRGGVLVGAGRQRRRGAALGGGRGGRGLPRPRPAGRRARPGPGAGPARLARRPLPAVRLARAREAHE